MRMIFVRKSIPLSTKHLLSTIFNHSIAESPYESIMDALEELLLALPSSTGWPCSIPCLPASYHIDVVLS